VTIHYSLGQLFGLNVGSREALWVKGARAAIVILIGGTLLLAAIGKLLDNRHFAEISGMKARGRMNACAKLIRTLNRHGRSDLPCSDTAQPAIPQNKASCCEDEG
jgi:hypothetical protein